MQKTAEGHLLKDDLSNYNHSKYERPSVTVDIIICSIIDDTLKVLLIKRKHPPYRGRWAIPGGFVQIENKETLEETAHRELLEETNLKGLFIEQLKTYGDPDRDPRMRVITVAYYALVPYYSKMKIKRLICAGDDAAEAEWFSLRHPLLRQDEVAFDHATILRDVLERIQGKATYSPILFNLVPKKFTWAELMRVYELVIGREFLAPNFRRWIKNQYKIRKHNDYSNSGGRPSRLLSYAGERKRI